ncbi:NADPH-dependent FMN reductase [Paenibacillus nasutitermitis]|uniref:FMN reductase n=1 Tax=Paenibacillus nasutitermitis TaxID=1652958 RepID=A0A916YPM5_9BACL|nr:NAD(P)H-dependent oxidoreductase [Paenibacillus nasutitermitis]GGD55413.1 FMN reductase [Paenibacillus nasutitermitis]
MLKIATIIGSTRPGRNGETVGRWVYEIANKRSDAEYELVDIADYHLPLLDEPMSPVMGHYTKEHTKVWSEKIASFDGYIFVTPTYNRATSGALKNAIDYLYKEWNNKAAGLISYGASGGSSAMDSLRLILSELRIAHVRSQVSFSLHTDFENYRIFKPTSHHESAVNAILDEVEAWGGALKTLRNTGVDVV